MTWPPDPNRPPPFRTLVAAANAQASSSSPSSSSSAALTSNRNRHPFNNLTYLRLTETGFPLPEQERTFLPQFSSYDPDQLWTYFLRSGLHAGSRIAQWQMTVWKRECRPALFQDGGIAPGGGSAGDANSGALSGTCDRCAVYGLRCSRSPVTYAIAAARRAASARGADGSTLGSVAAAPLPRSFPSYTSSVTSAGQDVDGVPLANVPAGAGLAGNNNGFQGNLWDNGREGPRTVMLRNAAVPVMQGAGKDPETGKLYSQDPFAPNKPTLCCDECFAAGGRSAARCSLYVYSPFPAMRTIGAPEESPVTEGWLVDDPSPSYSSADPRDERSQTPRAIAPRSGASPRHIPQCLTCFCEDMAENSDSKERRKDGWNLCTFTEGDPKCRRCREEGRDCVFGYELVDLNARLGDVVPALGGGFFGGGEGAGGGGGGGGGGYLSGSASSTGNGFSPGLGSSTTLGQQSNFNLSFNLDSRHTPTNGLVQHNVPSTSNNVPATQATRPQHRNVTDLRVDTLLAQQSIPTATTRTAATNNSSSSSDNYTAGPFQPPPSGLSTTTITSQQQEAEPESDLPIIIPGTPLPDTPPSATNTSVTDAIPPAQITTRKKCEGCEHKVTPGYKGKRLNRSCDTDLVNGRGCKQCVNYGLVCVLDGYVLPRHRDPKSHVGFTPCDSCKDAARSAGPARGAADAGTGTAGSVDKATLLCDRKQACDRCCLTNSYCHRSGDNSNARIVGIIGRDKPGADLEGFYLNAGKVRGQPGVQHPVYGAGKGKKHWVMPMDYHFQYLDQLGVPRPASADEIVELPGREGGVPLWLKKVRKVMDERAAAAAAAPRRSTVAVAGPSALTAAGGDPAAATTSSSDTFAQDLGIREEEDIAMGGTDDFPTDAATAATYLTGAEVGYDDFDDGAFFDEALYRMPQYANEDPDLQMWYEP